MIGPRDFGMMHFSRDQAGVIGRELTRFAETGALGESGKKRRKFCKAEENEIPGPDISRD